MYSLKDIWHCLFGKFNFTVYKLSSIDIGAAADEYVLGFVHRVTQQHYQMSLEKLFSNKLLLNKFDYEDAILIGHYYAKLSYQKRR